MKKFIEAIAHTLFPKSEIEYPKFKKLRWLKVGDKYVSTYVTDDRPECEWVYEIIPNKKVGDKSGNKNTKNQ